MNNNERLDVTRKEYINAHARVCYLEKLIVETSQIKGRVCLDDTKKWDEFRHEAENIKRRKGK